jgi:hypothetical protein
MQNHANHRFRPLPFIASKILETEKTVKKKTEAKNRNVIQLKMTNNPKEKLSE